MASSSTQPGTASRKSILIPVMTLEGHKPVASLLPDGNTKHTKMNHVSSICYFPDGEQLISGSDDKTTRRWDLQARKEIKEARDVREHEVCAVGVSRDGRWIVTAEGAFGSRRGELRVCEVETGIVKSFSEGHIGTFSFDISLDSTLLASSSSDGTVWIKSLKTGNMVAQFSNPSSYGPICSQAVGAIRLSQDSKKLAMKSAVAQSLEVWDLQAETCVRLGAVRSSCRIMTNAPMFWTAQDKTIITAFSFNSSNDVSTSDLKTIYEFDASTLKKVLHFHSIVLSSPARPMTSPSNSGPLSPASSSPRLLSNILAPSSSHPTHVNWFTRPGPRFIYATFHLTSLVAFYLYNKSRGYAFHANRTIHYTLTFFCRQVLVQLQLLGSLIYTMYMIPTHIHHSIKYHHCNLMKHLLLCGVVVSQ
jgi:WD40 repeat protein